MSLVFSLRYQQRSRRCSTMHIFTFSVWESGVFISKMKKKGDRVREIKSVHPHASRNISRVCSLQQHSFTRFTKFLLTQQFSKLCDGSLGILWLLVCSQTSTEDKRAQMCHLHYNKPKHGPAGCQLSWRPFSVA